MKDYRALVIGATGHVGRELVKTLMQRPHCTGITQITRRNSKHNPQQQQQQEHLKLLADAKLTTIALPTFSNISMQLSDRIPSNQTFDVAYCMLGTRQPTSLSFKEQKMVDVEYVASFAELCKKRGVRYFGYNSFVYADPHSSDPFTHFKAESERNLKEKRFERISFYKPAWISRPEPDLSEVKSNYDKLVLRFDHYSRDRFRHLGPLLYWPTFLLPDKLGNTLPDLLARAAVKDAEMFLDSESGGGGGEGDKLPVLGWKGLKRLYNGDIQRLANELDHK